MNGLTIRNWAQISSVAIFCCILACCLAFTIYFRLMIRYWAKISSVMIFCCILACCLADRYPPCYLSVATGRCSTTKCKIEYKPGVPSYGLCVGTGTGCECYIVGLPRSKYLQATSNRKEMLMAILNVEADKTPKTP